MNLTIDIGNTVTKLAVFDAAGLVKKYYSEDDDWHGVIEPVLNTYKLSAVIVSSVKERNTDLLRFLSEKLKVFELSHLTSLPILNNYSSPETLGKDRLAAVVGTKKYFSSTNVLVIDAGTCITFDFLTATNEYLGGSISPGLMMRFKAMHNFTAKLPLVNPDKNFDTLIGNTTESSMRSGVQNGMVAEIDGIINTYSLKHTDLKVFLTGGDSDFFAKKLKNAIFVVPDLVLEGLNEILKYNVQP